MSFRRFFVASSLVLSPLATIGFQSAALAETDSASVTLGGTVSSTVDIVAAPTSAASSLPITTGVQLVNVATLAIASNNTAGITITASSTNNGVLQSQTNPADGIGYTVAIVPSGASAPTSGVAPSYLSQSETTGFDATTGLKSMDLYIRYSVPSLPKRGTYGDTLSITVADN